MLSTAQMNERDERRSAVLDMADVCDMNETLIIEYINEHRSVEAGKRNKD